jgi:hypothetical protein
MMTVLLTKANIKTLTEEQSKKLRRLMNSFKRRYLVKIIQRFYKNVLEKQEFPSENDDMRDFIIKNFSKRDPNAESTK